MRHLIATPALGLILLSSCLDEVASPDDTATPLAGTAPAPTDAEAAWRAAEASPSAEAWERAAAAQEARAANPTLPAAERREAAYGAVLARKHAYAAAGEAPGQGADPVALSPRAAALVAAMDRFAGLVGDPADDEVIMMRFLVARTYWQHRQLEAAIPRLEALVSGPRGHATIEYSVNLLLDALDRAGRHDELAAWVDHLRGDAAWLAGRDELRERLDALHRAAR